MAERSAIVEAFAAGTKPNTPYVTILAGVERPFGSGSIHINSSDPLAHPVIDPKYLATGIGTPSIPSSSILSY
jgi:hypothetical protein